MVTTSVELNINNHEVMTLIKSYGVKKLTDRLELPPQAFVFLGCAQCEWRGISSLCDPTSEIEPEGKKLGVTRDCICRKRELFVKLCYRGNKTKPNYTDLVRDYKRSVMDSVWMKDLRTMNILEDKIARYEKSLS